MTAPGTGRRQPSRTDWVLLLLPYLLLPASSAFAALSGDISTSEVPRTVVTGLALIAWHTYWTLTNQQWLAQALAPMAVYYLGLLAGCAVLLQVSIDYLVLYLVSYALAFVVLPGVWAYAGLGLAAVVPLIVPGPMNVTGSNVAITLGGVALAAAIGWSIRRLEAETAARQVALAELADAHVDLKRALADNMDLQDRLVAEARESGVTAERARIAADIHDTLAAALTGIVSQLEAVDAHAPADERVRARVQVSMDLARDALREARHSIHALRPAVLERHSLPGALSALVAELERTGSLPAAFHLVGDLPALSDATEDTLVRIAREALTNIRRHAGATRVHVTLSGLGDQVALDVVDDGAGFDRDQLPPGGHGLDLMLERARHLGGTLDIQTRPGGGTTITASLPGPPPAEGSDG
ncbi:MAG TPA: sensor histidine kinase [Candidatus Ruania gallistercoris]|uniref:Sensor histidine kinase n=1 Tax=Candidatus Ruania gallistercoris TaxID=2838746 RepID=A0A9D2J4A2_9MICO|nr:sensor histidine kinase [Candidatus Ruania gallistercoris]